MPLACFKRVDTLLIAIETCQRHIYTLWRLRVCALLIVIETCQRHVPTLWRFFQFTLLCDGERDFFELEVEVV